MFGRRSLPQSSPTQRVVNVEQLSRNELLAHVDELRKYVEVVTRERDRLLRENEDYINNSVSATFDSSSFLRETLLSRESELQLKKTEFEHLKAERDELLEDVAMIKEAKRLSDRSCREVCAQALAVIALKGLSLYSPCLTRAMQPVQALCTSYCDSVEVRTVSNT
jgi:hypothetical protein